MLIIQNRLSIFHPLILVLGLIFQTAAQPTIRADKAYEDSVRILIISNDSAKGNCGGPTDHVGIKTRDFVKTSLAGIPNVVMRESKSTRWEDVLKIWSGKLPHVVVHINAGWYTESGDNINTIMNIAADSGIGVVSIGDDAAAFAEKTFGFQNVDNYPQPMADGVQYNTPESRLWIDLDGVADTIGGGGIVRLTTDSLKVNRLFFLPMQPTSGADPAGQYRCQADADKYQVDASYTDKVTFLGFQRAYDGQDTVAGPRELQTIVAFQDNVRRGVALSYQPQFLADAKAAHQIDYDAIIYASYAHFFRDPSLVFTDELGRALAPGANWDPGKGKLYLNYTDDSVLNLGKTIHLLIKNAGGVAADSEVIVVAVPVANSGGRGLWRGEIVLAEKNSVTQLNGITEVSLPSQIEASVASHDEAGLPDGGMAVATLKLFRPPVIDTILFAYMRDVNGNGAADQAVFQFTQPLTTLPSSIGPVYWNDLIPALANKRPPRLTFLAGSAQKVVVADFSDAEFPLGLTSIPIGGKPQAIFPSEGVFGGQKPALADSIGPILLKADIAIGSMGSERVSDTLVLSVSEILRPGFPSLIRYGRPTEGKCADRDQSLPITMVGAPTPTADSLGYVLILNATAANPVSGDCLYLEGNTVIRDMPGNVASSQGILLTGPKRPRGILSVVGYPAVSAKSRPQGTVAGGGTLTWIPPEGYQEGVSFVETHIPAHDQIPVGKESTPVQPLSGDVALVRVTSTGRYLAEVTLFDNLGIFVKRFRQSFGYKGELENPARREGLGYLSDLIWDRRNSLGSLAGQGVYIWSINFTLDDGTHSHRDLRTGLLR